MIAPGADGLLLVVGAGARPYREYLLASMASRRVWLLDDAPADWQRRHLVRAIAVPRLSVARLGSNTNALIDRIQRTVAGHAVAGVLTYEEPLVVATAHLAERLCLPGLSVEGAENCRDKRRTRQILTAAGLAQPAFGYAVDCPEALRIADRIGYPVVIKPRGVGGSLGVVRVDEPAAVESAFTAAAAAAWSGNVAYSDGVLVERLIDGPEISVDGAVRRGGYRPVFVARKTVSHWPYFEESGHIVDPVDPLYEDDELIAMLEAAHRALGVRDGVTHTEVKITRTGFVIVEVNARLGGDLIPYLGKLATGVDAAGIAADIATGVPVGWPERRDFEDSVSVGIRFCYPPADGVVRGVALPRPADVPGLIHAAQIAPDGATLRLPPRGYASRYAYVICEGAGPARCAGALRAAADRVSLDLDPE